MGLRDPYVFMHPRHISGALAFLASTVNEKTTWPRPGTSSHHLLYEIYDRFDRFTRGREIDEILADILFIYALMGALQAAFLTIHLINP